MTAAQVPVAHDTRFCGGSTRAGTPCRRPAGWGTDHARQGRCKLHGGRNPVRHGRYSTVQREAVRELAAEFERDASPLDLLPELAQARALYVDYVNRFDAFQAALLDWHESYRAGAEDVAKKPRQMLDPADAMRLLSEVTRIVKRIEDVHAHNAIGRGDFYRVLTEMGRVVDTEVADPDVRERIRNRWLEIRLA